MQELGGPIGYRVVLAAFAVLTVTFAVPADANIFGHDDRRDILATDGLSGVGTIVCEGTTRRPTASLVGLPARHNPPSYDVIATVSHAFIGANEQRLTSCEFWPQADAALAAKIVFLETGTLSPDGDWNNDWAVAVLDRRLPETLIRFVPRVLDDKEASGKRTKDAHFLMAGHNGERGPLQISEGCGPVSKSNTDLNGFDTRVFNHDCDMMPGWSGGPLILREGGVNYLVAVNSTEVNAITHISGRPYDGRMNPNTAVRVDGRFGKAMTEILRHGAPGARVKCLVASRDENPPLPC